MMLRVVGILAFFGILVFGHGIFYDLKEQKALVFHINFSQTVPARFAKVVIYEGESAIPIAEGVADANGAYAFVPPKAGKYRVDLSGTSDHGEHSAEFDFEVGKDLVLQEYKQPIFERYAGVLSAVGILFGLFGLLSLIKSRKKS